MLRAYNLYKKFGAKNVLQNFSCQIPRNTIVGLLGANGAGKSTVMRLLAGCCSPDAGEIFLGGYNLYEQPYLARSQMGYLPETSPSYLDMRVSEYITFVGKLKSTSCDVNSLLVECQLEDVYQQKIQYLSKGYRQRVGLAQALVGNPSILIIDEPTAGLDPRQIQETRRLLRYFGTSKTILLSTHILSEVEQICDSVIILHKGEIRLTSTMYEIQKYGKLEDMYMHVTGAERAV